MRRLTKYKRFAKLNNMQNTIKDYMSVIGKKGGNTTKKRYGKGYFSKIAKMKKNPLIHKRLAEKKQA